MTVRATVTDRSGPVRARDRLAADVRAGLAADPPSLPPKWFYDEKGSLLFEEITQLPEYYPSRTEERVLTGSAAAIAATTGATTLVELGSGTSHKTRLLLDALTAGGRDLLFAPLDVSVEVLVGAAQRISAAYPTVTVSAVVADFEDALAPLPGAPGGRLVAFLGSTIGNFLPAARRAFLGRLADALAPGDHLLLGVDLVKDPQRLVAAYDDAAGVTAAFNRNVLEVLDRELDGDLDPDDFAHEAVWNAGEERIEMWLRARVDVTAHLRAIELTWALAAGDRLLTETSHKFRLPAVGAELAAAGLPVVRSWTDPDGDYAVVLGRRGAAAAA